MSTLGLLLAWRDNPITAWSERAYQDDVLHGRFFGRSSFILNQPDAIRHVLIDNYENYRRSPSAIRILRPMFGEGLLMAEDKAWKGQRRNLAPLFTPRAVATMVPHILAVIDEAIQRLDGQRNEPLDLREAMEQMTLEIVGRTLFSLGMAKHGPALRGLITEYGSRLARLHLWDMLLDWPGPQDVQRYFFRRRWTKVIRQLVAERLVLRRADSAPRDLFDLIVATDGCEVGQAKVDTGVIDQVATMLLAGYETTATALFWSLFLLAQEPAAQEAVADEANASIVNGETDVNKLRLSRAVINEAMRLYPPAYLIERVASGSDEIDGKTVRRGDTVFMVPWLLHHHEKLWQNPNAFVPQRFLSGPPPDRFAYFPFGIGPRACIGSHLALAEMTLALAKIIGRFRIELLSTRPVVPVGIVTTQPDHSPAFRISRR
jgi:unspecific monooxygenase